MFSLDNILHEVDTRVGTAVNQHVAIINANFEDITKLLNSIVDRQAAQDERNAEIHEMQVKQKQLIPDMFNRMEAWGATEAPKGGNEPAANEGKDKGTSKARMR